MYVSVVCISWYIMSTLRSRFGSLIYTHCMGIIYMATRFSCIFLLICLLAILEWTQTVICGIQNFCPRICLSNGRLHVFPCHSIVLIELRIICMVVSNIRMGRRCFSCRRLPQWFSFGESVKQKTTCELDIISNNLYLVFDKKLTGVMIIDAPMPLQCYWYFNPKFLSHVIRRHKQQRPFSCSHESLSTIAQIITHKMPLGCVMIGWTNEWSHVWC